MLYPGHCRLLLEQIGIMAFVIYNALCRDENGRPLLCSDIFVNILNTGNRELKPDEIKLDRAGPSIPASFGGILKIDTVHSLPCYCPSILKRWSERRRHWPSPDIVRKVVSLGAYVTPVGFKGSDYRHVEWRI
ncbi:hypothetical protein DPMN_039026 [Dreissena polymorpha]|uniref:Uncharacterized protein n=1 Tax=Dreissena polymorpha TaxID=45954 RepID=A0A9D4MEA3_DREPO|nr:hypothetical protein DPMN_039026 [Dreissena polymorpha]